MGVAVLVAELVTNVIVFRIEPFRKRDHIPVVIVSDGIGRFNLGRIPNHIAQPTAYRLAVHKVPAFIQNNAVIRQVVFFDVLGQVVSVRPIRQSGVLQLPHAVFHPRFVEQFPHFRNPRVKGPLHFDIGGIKGIRVSCFAVPLGIALVLGKVRPPTESREPAAFFRAMVEQVLVSGCFRRRVHKLLRLRRVPMLHRVHVFSVVFTQRILDRTVGRCYTTDESVTGSPQRHNVAAGLEPRAGSFFVRA